MKPRYQERRDRFLVRKREEALGCRRFNHTIKLVAVGGAVRRRLARAVPLQKPCSSGARRQTWKERAKIQDTRRLLQSFIHGHGLPLPLRDLLLRRWLRRQPLRLRSLPVPGADLQEDPQGQVHGAVRRAPLPALPAQLLHLPLVWPPLGLRRPAARRHRQRHRSRVPARLHFPLLHLRRQQEDQAEDGRAPGSPGLRVRPRRARERRFLRPAHPAAVRRRRQHGVAHLHVCFPTGRHGRGDPDGVRGVHALLPLALHAADERLFRDIRGAAA